MGTPCTGRSQAQKVVPLNRSRDGEVNKQPTQKSKTFILVCNRLHFTSLHFSLPLHFEITILAKKEKEKDTYLTIEGDNGILKKHGSRRTDC